VQVYVYMMEVFQVYALHPSKLEQGGAGTSSASHQQHVGTKGGIEKYVWSAGQHPVHSTCTTRTTYVQVYV
jgi:hypothetical protein